MIETCFMSKGHAGKHQGYLAAPTSQGPPWCGEEVPADPYEAPDGYWTTDAPLSPDQVDEDMAAIRAMVIPRSITVQSAEVYVNGRLWNWKADGDLVRCSYATSAMTSSPDHRCDCTVIKRPHGLRDHFVPDPLACDLMGGTETCPMPEAHGFWRLPPVDDPHAPHRAHIDHTRRQIKAEQDPAAPPSKKVKA